MDIHFFNLYNSYLFEKGYIEADTFKNTKIPNVLYKFFPSNKKRIELLANQELWLAHYKTFNDPNEFEFMYIDEKNFIEAKPFGVKWHYYNLGENFFKIHFDDAKKIMDAQKNLVSISCFTTNPNNDYFWSEYANNKNGFCVEYNINDKDKFYPVIYTDEKIEISRMLKTFILEIQKTNLDDIEFEQRTGKKHITLSEDGLNYLSFLYFNYCCKKTKWENENEYRLVFSNDTPTTKGTAISYNDLCISANKITIGTNCSNQDKETLKKIAEKLNIGYCIYE